MVVSTRSSRMSFPSPSLRFALTLSAALAFLAGCPGSQTPPSLTDETLGDTTQGVAFSRALAATGGKTPYTFTAAGLPAGISLAADGALSGTATASGDFSVQVTVTDAAAQSATKALPLKVYSAPTFTTA